MDNRVEVIVTGAHGIGNDGIATMVYRWGMNLPDNIKYIYLMPKGYPPEEYKKKILSNNDEILVPDEGLGKIRKICWMFKEFSKRKNSILHINQDRSYIVLVYAVIARLCGIKKIIAHSHNSSIDSNSKMKRFFMISLHYLCRPFMLTMLTCRLTCSKKASVWLYGEKIAYGNSVLKIYNGVDLSKFYYSEDDRKKYRGMLELKEDETAFVTVGRLTLQKNLFFMINQFDKYLRINPNSYLFIIGEGVFKNDLKVYAESKQCGEKVIFLGARSDVSNLLSAMDVFVMTSIFEGLPLVLVEAQMTGLPCVVSNRVSDEANISSGYLIADLDSSDEWKEKLEKARCMKRSLTLNDEVKKYDINYSVNQLAYLYNKIEK